jgi:hypothetical protein
VSRITARAKRGQFGKENYYQLQSREMVPCPEKEFPHMDDPFTLSWMFFFVEHNLFG